MPHGPEHVNVAAQLHDPESLWSFMRKLISIRRTCPELGWGTWSVVEQPLDRASWCSAATSTARPSSPSTTSAPSPATVDVPVDPHGEGLEAIDLMSDEVVTGAATTRVTLEGYGYRWLRVRPAGDLAIP